VYEIQSAHGNRCALYSSYDEAIGKFKQSKDATMLAASRKKVDGDHKRVTAEVAELVDVLKANAAPADVVEKVNELQRLDGSFKEQASWRAGEQMFLGLYSRGTQWGEMCLFCTSINTIYGRAMLLHLSVI
jgi:hypothetical protein